MILGINFIGFKCFNGLKCFEEFKGLGVLPCATFTTLLRCSFEGIECLRYKCKRVLMVWRI